MNRGPRENKSENKNTIVVTSDNRYDNIDGGEETEIAAQISVPPEGGWGWVVVFASFWSIFLMDGVAFCYGSIFKDITTDLGVTESLVALVNSITMAIYFIGSPVASAIINRFGFRVCIMSGSLICSAGLFISHFVTTILMLYIFYGFFIGLGCCFINMSTALVVGFYFERLRSAALAIASTGSSLGVMVMYPLNSYVAQVAGWRVVALLQSGLFGLIYFFGMTYRPLLSLTVVKTTDGNEPTRTVTYLPSLATIKATSSRTKTASVPTTAAERLFGAISNVHFPTAAQVVVEGKVDSSQPGPSTRPVSRLTLTANNPKGGLNQRQLNQVKSMMSKASVQEGKTNIELHVPTPLLIKKEGKIKWWRRMFHWEEHVEESRPMYRDDAFYDGRVDRLPVYQKSMMETTPEARTGLEYQLAVSRAATAADLKDKRGVFTTAAKRVIVTMMDPKLLSLCSFRLLCLSGFLTCLGYLVPYVFIQDRNKTVGIEPTHCDLFVSAIGLGNIVGKLAVGALACKIDAFKLYYVTTIMAGLATMLSNISFDIYYQYAYCGTFGFLIAGLACLRSSVIVKFYGLQKLTNATGMMLTFQGLGSLVSTPLASAVKNSFGYDFTFYIAGLALALSGFVIIPMSYLSYEYTIEEKSNVPPPPKTTPVKIK